MNAAATTLRLPLGPRERPLDVDVGDGLRVAALRLDPRASTIDIEVGTIAAQEEGRIASRQQLKDRVTSQLTRDGQRRRRDESARG